MRDGAAGMTLHPKPILQVEEKDVGISSGSIPEVIQRLKKTRRKLHAVSGGTSLIYGTLGAIRENIGIQKHSKYIFPRHDTLDHAVISRDRKTGDPYELTSIELLPVRGRIDEPSPDNAT